MLGRLRRPGTQAALVGAALAGVLSVSTAVLATAGPAEPPPARTEAVAVERPAPGTAPGTVVAEGAVRPSPLPTAPVAVAPLGALHRPDVVVRSTAPLGADVVAALQGLPGLAALALLDAGTAPVGGAPAEVVGVDPSEFRAFTPQETATSDELWAAVARGDLAVSPGLAAERSLALGGTVDAGRVGAVAVFGPTAGGVLTTRERARALGAVADAVAVVSAPEVGRAALEKAVRAVAGDAEITVLRPADVAPSAVRAAPNGKPRDWRELYVDSARYCPGLSWTVLAAIGQVESAHGIHLGPSSAGALGPMQFMPATWGQYGIDGDGDGRADIMNPFDAVPSAANYLCASGAQRGEQGLYDAVFAYNRADWYVRKVLGIAAQYA